jgi:tetratricopeptide (TPR) repeat protein
LLFIALICAVVPASSWGGTAAFHQGAPAVGPPEDAADLAKWAEEQSRLGRTEQAAEAYRKVLRLDPQYEPAYLGLADLLSRSGKRDERIALLYSAHALIPASADIAHALANELFSARQYDEAIKIGKECLVLNPKDAPILANIGEAYFALNQLSNGIDALEQATALDSNLKAALYNLGLAYRRVGRYQDALITMRKILGQDPPPDFRNQAWLEMFANLERLGRIAEASTETEKELGLHPDSPYALFARGDIRQAQYQLEGALADLAQALALAVTPDIRSQIYFGLCNTYMKMSRFPEAIEMANKALEIASDDEGYKELRFNCENILAAAYGMTARCDKAMDAFEKAIGLRPDDMSVYNNLSICLKDSGHLQDAERAIRYAIGLEPDRWEPRYNLSLVLLERRQFTEAEAELRNCLRLGGKDWRVYLNFGRLLLEQNRLKEAASMYTQAHQLQPANPMIMNDLAFTLAELDERQAEALDLAQRAVRANPASAAFLDTLGWAYFRYGKYPEAEKELLLALQKSPGQAEIFEHLGYVYEKEGETAEAISSWKKAFSLTNDEEMKGRLRGKLEAK